MEFYSHIKIQLDQVEEIMKNDLEKENNKVYGMLWPFINRGGKRIRPVLALLGCGVVEGKYSEVVEPAAILELFHNFTLIHDDIEDDSQFRRGEPTLHISHGIAMALNSADALYTLLWKKLANLKIDEKKLVLANKMYSEGFKKVVDGQGIEIEWIKNNRFDISEQEYLSMINGKTSALMGLSCEIGVFFGNGSKKQMEQLRNYGEKIGLAFQIEDDVLNLIGNFEKYQKEIGGDITEGKRTLMVVHGLKNLSKSNKEKLIKTLKSHTRDQNQINETISMLKDCGSIEYAQRIAKNFVDEAKNSLEMFENNKDRKSLQNIADYVINREK